MKLYKIINSRQETDLLEADLVELDTVSSRLNFLYGGELVGSYNGYSSFSVVDPSLLLAQTVLSDPNPPAPTP